MSATRLWSPVTRPAPFWLKPLPRNACSPVADGAALGTCVSCPPLPPPPAAGCPREADARTGQDHGVSACAGIDRPLWHGLLTAYARCLGRLLPGRARHLTVPSTSPCTSCGCGCFNLHAHIHSWCTTNLAFAASFRTRARFVRSSPRGTRTPGLGDCLATASTSGPSGVYARYKLAASPHEGHERTISPRTRTPWPHAPSLPRAGPAGPRDARAERSRTSEFTESTETPRK